MTSEPCAYPRCTNPATVQVIFTDDERQVWRSSCGDHLMRHAVALAELVAGDATLHLEPIESQATSSR